MPMGNKACNERHVRKCQDFHKLQLATVKSTIDNKPPKTIKTGALTTNAKKQQIMVSVDKGSAVNAVLLATVMCPIEAH